MAELNNYEDLVKYRDSVLKSIEERHKAFNTEINSSIENINKNLSQSNKSNNSNILDEIHSALKNI